MIFNPKYAKAKPAHKKPTGVKSALVPLFAVILAIFIATPVATADLAVHLSGDKGDKLPFEFCQGTDMMSMRYEKIMHELVFREGNKDDLPQIKECMKNHHELFPRFMKYYQEAIPTLIINPPLDNTTMTSLEIVKSDIPDYNSLRLAARSIGMFGEYYRLTSKPLKAARVYVTLLKCGIDSEHGFGTIKSEITKMVAVGVEELALRKLAYLFATRALDAGKERSILKNVEKLLTKRAPLVEVARTVRANQVKYDIKELAKHGEIGKLTWVEKVLYSSLGGRAGTHYHRMINELFEDIEKAVQMDYPQGKTLLEQVSEKIMKITREAQEPGFSIITSPAERMGKVLISISVANWEIIWNNDWQIPVLKDGLDIIHLLNEYHRKHGQYPDELKQLSEISSAKIPRDVFTGKPFVYRRSGTSFVLYSRGGDGAFIRKPLYLIKAMGDIDNDVIIVGKHSDESPEAADDRWTGRREMTTIVKGEPCTLHLPGDVTLEMVWIPPGEFDMGSPGEEIENLCGEYDYIGETFNPFRCEAPRHKVRITHGFWIGRFEVTQSQWQTVMDNNPSIFKKGMDGVPPDTGTYPVENVSWDDCKKFLEKLSRGIVHNCRLPTEIQWEYACRAGTTSRYTWGDEFTADGTSNIENAVDNFGNAEKNSSVFKQKGFPVGSTMPAGSLQPNAWNLYDMHGNVREWCRDWYSVTCYRDGLVDDPAGPESGTERVVRGGSWNTEAALSRSAARHSGTTDMRLDDVGFRIVIEPKE